MFRIFLILSIYCFTIGSSVHFFDDVKMYGCRCLLKDKTERILNSLTGAIPRNSNQPIINMDMRAREPTFTSNLQSKIHFLRQWLSTLTLDTHPNRIIPTTTTTTTTPSPPPPPPPSRSNSPNGEEDLFSLPFDTDSTRNSVFMRLAQKVVTKYFKKISGEWSILEKFECVCDGNLIDLLKSKTFINIQIAHD